jgi:hypothetical protein
MREYSIGSREYVPMVITARLNGIVTDPTGFPVEIAFTADGDTTAPTSFTAATWDVDTSGATPLYIAKVLVGPGGALQLAVGVWNSWAKVTASPEIPLIPGPQIRIF